MRTMNRMMVAFFLLAGGALWGEEHSSILFFLVDDMGVGDTSATGFMDRPA